jgi:transcription elongation GreA/GreB family factor
MMVSTSFSVRSPFGQSIIGKKVGESFSFTAPNGELSYKIVEIK